MKQTPTLAPIVLVAALLGGCGTESAVYTSESFASDSPFKLKIDGQIATACESARRSLLGQGYRIESAGAEQVQGRKAYRSAGKQNTFIEMNIVCVPDNVGSTLFANGVLSTYDLKKSSSAASVGLSAIGSISLPIGQSADSLVKIAEETISDKDFYARFFAAVGLTLGEMRGPRPAEPDAVVPTPAIPIEPGPAIATTVPATPAETAPPLPVRPAPPVAPSNVTVVTTPASGPVVASTAAQPQPTPVTATETAIATAPMQATIAAPVASTTAAQPLPPSVEASSLPGADHPAEPTAENASIPVTPDSGTVEIAPKVGEEPAS